MLQTKNKSIDMICFPILVLSSKKRVNNGKKWQNAKNGDVADENFKKYIHNLEAFINMLRKKEYWDNLFFLRFLSMDPLPTCELVI